MKKLVAKVNTFLKKLPIAAGTLPLKSVKAIAAGESIQADKIDPVEGKHSKVDLAYGQGTWFIFAEHWDGLSTEIVSRATAEHIFDTQISDALLADLNACCDRYSINTPARLRHFLSQIAHESGGLQWLQELATGDDYEWRDDLGNNQPGDGRRFKGAGVIQLTGRANYQAFANAIADPRVMEGVKYVAAKYPVTSAGFWWTNNRMNELCDRGASVEQVTRRVNGGLNGIDDREYYYRRCCDVI